MQTLDVTAPTPYAPRAAWSDEENLGTGTRRLLGISITTSVESETSADSNSGVIKAICGETLAISRRNAWSRIFTSDFVPLVATDKDVILPWKHTRLGSAEPITDAEILGRIQHSLSLSTTQLAAAMQVERPTVYSWLKGGPMRTHNQSRLNALYEVSQTWWKMAARPLGSSLQLKDSAGRSMMDLLSKEFSLALLHPFFTKALKTGATQASSPLAQPEPFHLRAARLGYKKVSAGAKELNLRSLENRG